MPLVRSVSRTTYALWVLGVSLLLASPTFAVPPAGSPCSTSGVTQNDPKQIPDC